MELAPEFQRRAVWKTPARSFFIDTLIQSYPVPPVYLRVTQNADYTKTVREVIDGQQRLRAVLGFIDGDFALSRSLHPAWAGREFNQLDTEHQDAIRSYPLICEIMHGISDAEVLEIFSRLNTYSVQLNAQELRNGTYFGYFKQCAYSLAHEHIEFWRNYRIFTQNGISRMGEVELTSELLILLMDGIQDKKNSINRFYSEFDDEFPGQSKLEKRFRAVIDDIVRVVGDDLRTMEFRRPPLFYSLFGAVAHRRFGVPGIKLQSKQKALSSDDERGLRATVARLSDAIVTARTDDEVPRRYAAFVNASLRQTDNIQPRRVRLSGIYDAAF